jgi:hypothetical protein
VFEERDQPPPTAVAGDVEAGAHEPASAHAGPSARDFESIDGRPLETLDVERNVGRRRCFRVSARAHSERVIVADAAARREPGRLISPPLCARIRSGHDLDRMRDGGPELVSAGVVGHGVGLRVALRVRRTGDESALSAR